MIFSKDEWDSPEALRNDIQAASVNTSNEEAINILLSRGSKILEEVLIEKVKTEFSYEGSKLALTKEAAHSLPRIIHKDDYTGKSIQISLLNYLNNKSGPRN